MAKKTLFKTPTTSNLETPGPSSSSNTNEELQSLMKKIEVEMQVESNYKAVQKELHEKRLEKMRQLLEESAKDAWKYESIDKLLSLWQSPVFYCVYIG